MKVLGEQSIGTVNDGQGFTDEDAVYSRLTKLTLQVRKLMVK